jgi:adenylate kinase
VQRKGIVALSSGEIFRREIDAQTDLGRLANRFISQGQLVPNEVTIEMMAKRIGQLDVMKAGFVLDGFPRTIPQAQALDELLDDMGKPLDKVVSISADDEIIVARLSGRIGCTKCGEIYHARNKPPKREGLCDKCDGPLFVRQDDRPEAIRQRLAIFHEQTSPVIDYYEKKGLLQRVDGRQDPETVFKVITGESGN